MWKSMLILLLVASSARAEWALIAVANTPARRIFVDLATIRPAGSYLRMWSMYDVDTEEVSPSGIKFKSAKQLEELDCIRSQRRVLAVSLATGSMGSGSIVTSDLHERPDWRAHRPDSMNEITAQVVCDLDAYLVQPEAWEPFGEADGMKVFIDLSRSRRTGSVARVRLMFDYSTPQPSPGRATFRSLVFVSEYDCEKHARRHISMVTRTGQGWKGQVTEILASGESPFQAYPPDDELADAACSIGK